MFDSFLRRRVAASLLLASALSPVPHVAAQVPPDPDFITFESGQVTPMALSPSGRFLYATNTPDNRLAVFRVFPTRLVQVSVVPVGMEPVAVAVRSEAEVWVVNHLSDSVSIIRDDDAGRRVVRTLQVGDEPRDIVFAGPDRRYALITTAHRELDRAAGTGNADVWVFDTQDLGDQAGGEPLTVLNLYSEVPRSLAVSPDGNTVYAASFFSGNRTTAISRRILDGDVPPPYTNVEGVPAPEVALIVRYDGEKWVDGAGRDMSDKVRPVTLTDNDVFAIDVSSPTQAPTVTEIFEGVGTTLFNLAVNPANGELYVSNFEALNEVRFEGPGEFGGSTVRGHFVESRVTVLDPVEGTVAPRHLNKHIDYDSFPGTPEENAASLAQPTDMVVTGDGETLYVAAFGSSRIGVFDTEQLRNDTFAPSPDAHIVVSGGGPSGLVLDEARRRLYAFNRFDNSISIIDTQSAREIAVAELFNPEPASVTEGRRFLYDARYTSSRGDSSCGGCHIFGDMDHLAWDLGDPDALVFENKNPLERPPLPRQNTDFHPMKGPMTTQSLRGMANQGPMHWRGDRSGATDGGDPFDEEAAFKTFNPAFEGLLGRTEPLTDDEMQAFADFALQLFYPPNPLRRLDDTLTPLQEEGAFEFFEVVTVPSTGDRCNDCHVISPEEGFYGTDGVSAIRDSQVFKTPHFRNLYTKAGRPETQSPVSKRFRGFGYAHSGDFPTLTTFLNRFAFSQGRDSVRAVTEFLLVTRSDLAPIVGEQVTLAFDADNTAFAKLQLMRNQALLSPRPNCNLVAKGRLNNEQRGWLMLGSGRFLSDRIEEPPLSYRGLLQIAQTPGQEITFTCVPPGDGVRLALDRDMDGKFDRDELDDGEDPSG